MHLYLACTGFGGVILLIDGFPYKLHSFDSLILMSLFEVLQQYLKSQLRVHSHSILAADIGIMDLANLDGALNPSGPFSQTLHGKHLSTCIAIIIYSNV